MKPSLLLHEIIRSLSPEEKAAFLQGSSLQQGEKNYKKLFVYMDSVEEYNEEKAKEYFKNETFAKHLASEKNQLFHHILKSLRQQRIHDKSSAATFEKIKDVQLLYDKNLPKMANKEAERIRYRTIQEELFYSHLDLIEIEIQYMAVNGYDQEEAAAKLQVLFEEKELILKKVATLNKYQQLLREIEYYFNQNILVHDRSKKHLLESFLSNPYIADLTYANSKKALLHGTFCRLICYRIMRENEVQGREIDNAVELFKTYGYLKEEYPKMYIGLNGFLARYLAINANLKKAKIAIDHLRSIKDDKCFQTQDLQNTIFTRLTVYDLIFYNYSGQYEKAEVLFPEIEANLEKNRNDYEGHELTTINFLMFVTYFARKNYNKALKCINELNNSNFEESRQDLYRYAKLCNLIIHYELNNIDYLIYSYKSTQRFFKLIDYPFDFESTFLNYFKNIAISKKRSANKKMIFGEFRAQLEEIFKDPYQMIASEYFDLIAWIDSHLNETDYATEIIKARTDQ
ncbi:MAG: hypothetical protein SGJ15_07670 [Bacteroidota bacterium]|nr:hypothetical protein [Bacteroidota bacterium]